MGRSDNMVMPQALLEKSLDKRVSLFLKDGRVLEGKLTGFDEYMNMVLDETVENNAAGEEERRLGTVVLRGNNVVSISIL
jgi:small nuclear ribonucleoprotein